MHKLILKLFKFLKEVAEFIKILALMGVILYLLYWIENLVDAKWAWNNFIEPVFNILVYIGSLISTHKINLFGAVFEFQYFIGLVFFFVIYILGNLLIKVFDILNDVYDSSRQFVRKAEENIYNKKMEIQMELEQKKIKNFQVFVSTSVKQDAVKRGLKVDLTEQNKLMNKFLIGKTGVCPQLYNNGFLFLFNNVLEMDKILSQFFKLLDSNSPLDYFICVQIFGKDDVRETSQLDSLLELKIKNKIICMADTVYRYGYIDVRKYNTTLVGLFGSGSKTFEVHEFYLSDF